MTKQIEPPILPLRYNKKLLSFEMFARYCNNFPLHFIGESGKHWAGDAYRAGTAFQGCLAAHPQEFGKLLEELRQKLKDSKNIREPANLPKFYEAYKMMYPFARRGNCEIFE